MAKPKKLSSASIVKPETTELNKGYTVKSSRDKILDTDKAIENAPKVKKNVDKLVKKIRKMRSDKGKKRGAYKPRETFDPNKKLKQDMAKINNKIKNLAPHLAESYSKEDALAKKKEKGYGYILDETPAAFKAAKDFAKGENTSKFFKSGDLPQFDISSVDSLSGTELTKLKSIIYGNGKLPGDRNYRSGLLNAQTLTFTGVKQVHKDAYASFLTNYGLVDRENITYDAKGHAKKIVDPKITFRQYNDFWKKFNENISRMSSEAYDQFYNEMQQEVMDGLFQREIDQWNEWLDKMLKKYADDLDDSASEITAAGSDPYSKIK